jgi:hypothetical protein
MPLTAEQMRAADAARRMLSDESFLTILNRITADAAEKAVFLEDATAREANRQLVLAISRVRGELEADADLPESVKADEARTRAMEV